MQDDKILPKLTMQQTSDRVEEMFSSSLACCQQHIFLHKHRKKGTFSTMINMSQPHTFLCHNSIKLLT